MRRIQASKLYFPKEYFAMKELLKDLKIKPMTDIWIFDRYPRGWDAVFGFGKKEVMVIEFDRKSELYDIEYYTCYGFRKNGTLIYR
jgi:hypothetical protein